MVGETSQPKSQTLVAFQCPNCGSKVNIRAKGYSIAAACGACGSVIDTTDSNYQVLNQARQKASKSSQIPLGMRGKIRGIELEVIGFMERTDQSGYRWREYLLFNPRKGFYWLVEFDNHWSFVRSFKSRPNLTESKSVATLNGKSFRLYSTGQATVNYVVGEFYWRVSVGEKTEIVDYIAPPEILSMETMENEVIWSLGTYVKPEEVKDAFKLKSWVSLPLGVAPNQPNPHSERLIQMLVSLLFFVPVMMLIQFWAPDGFSDNFWVALCLLGAPVLLVFILHLNFEGARGGILNNTESLLSKVFGMFDGDGADLDD